MKNILKKSLIISFLGCANLFAHPHFFIDSSITIQKNQIEHTWAFDKMNSKLLMFDFDNNKNKILDKKEQEKFIKNHFTVLDKDNYNMFLETSNGEEIIAPKNINVQFIQKRVVINFITKTDYSDSMTFCTIDPTLYMAFSLQSTTSNKKLNIQKSKYDYCIGVSQ